MAKMMSEKERKMRKIVATVGESAKSALDVYGWVMSPHTKAIEVAADRMSKVDKVRKIRGPQRNRAQYLNPRTQKWVKVDARTGRILKHKKTYGPYKNVRKVKAKPKAQSGGKKGRRK